MTDSNQGEHAQKQAAPIASDAAANDIEGGSFAFADSDVPTLDPELGLGDEADEAASFQKYGPVGP